MSSGPPSLQIRRAADRFVTRGPGTDSRHSFSFARHYDPENVAHGLLLVHNEDRVAPGAGYDTHPHADTEIVTWVLSGSLRHEDSSGHAGVLRPGQVQLLSAGSGVRHAERNAAAAPGGYDAAEPVRFVQMWVPPDEPGLPPSYQQADPGEPDADRWTLLASGLPSHRADAPVRVGNRAAALHVARLRPGARLPLPDAPFLHLFVARGGVELEGAGLLAEGDAVRVSGGGGQLLRGAGARAGAGAELLLWEMHRGRT